MTPQQRYEKRISNRKKLHAKQLAKKKEREAARARPTLVRGVASGAFAAFVTREGESGYTPPGIERQKEKRAAKIAARKAKKAQKNN